MIAGLQGLRRTSRVNPPIAIGGLPTLALAAAALMLAPAVLSGYQIFLLNQSLGYAVAALGVAVAFATLGVLALSQAAIMAVGAYAMTSIGADLGLPVLLAIPAAMLIGAAISALFALVTNGVTDLAFAILGFALTFLFAQFLSGSLLGSFSGGDLGRSVPAATLFGFDVSEGNNSYYFCAVVTLLAFGFASLVQKSTLGRTVFMIGRNAPVVTSGGQSVARWRVGALAAVGAYGALGGCLVAQASDYVSPTVFSPALSVILLAIALFGGVKYLLGGLVGAIALQAVPGMLDIPAIDRDILVGAVLLVVLVTTKDGVLGLFDRPLRWAKDRIGPAARTEDES